MSRTSDLISAGVGRLIEDLAALVENEDLADIVFLIGPQEERVFAHSLILKTRYVLKASYKLAAFCFTLMVRNTLLPKCCTIQWTVGTRLSGGGMVSFLIHIPLYSVVRQQSPIR